MRGALLAMALVAALGANASGCYFTRSPIRPMPALAFLHDAGRVAPCLVIFVPGLMDGPDSFLEHEFPQALGRSGAACDSVAVDATYRYYFGADVASVLYEDVLFPAAARGYEEIWLVGISLGALGTLMLAREHADLIDGIILLSPFLGLDDVVGPIGAAGGLAAWRAPDPMPARLADDNFTLFVWSWLRGYVDDPDAMPELYVGWSEGERVAPAATILGSALAPEHALSLAGHHDWASWGPLLDQLLARARVGR
jgi:pimeloyl-ACP methyl ester carboxylesterase